jgi:hypothetical protein
MQAPDSHGPEPPEPIEQREVIMNRMLMLSGAMVLALVTGGTANAGGKGLDCHDANGRAIACAAEFGDANAARASRVFQVTNTGAPAPEEEQVIVVRSRPIPEAIPNNPYATSRATRPGRGGDWTPVVATSPQDQLQQWRDTYLSGDGLVTGPHN